MRRSLGMVSDSGGMVRRHLVIAAGIGIFMLGIAHALILLVEFALPDEPQRLAAGTPPSGQTRVYTITRSVLDDNLSTGSIPRPKASRVDPCRE